MENATKAMLIAAGVLIGVMILSLGVVLYSDLNVYVESTQENMRFNELDNFNTQFTQYINYIDGEKQFDLTIHDVISVANLAHQNNIDYNTTSSNRGNENDMYVAVYLNGKSIEDMSLDLKSELLKNNIKDGIIIKQYKCTEKNVIISSVTGRVYEVHFSEE